MTKEESIKMFREMWSDMADYIEAIKKTIEVYYFKGTWLEIRGIRCINFCPLCEYAEDESRLYSESNICIRCPIQWESDMNTFMCEMKHCWGDHNGLWIMCRDAETWQEQAALARKISELPEREDL